MRIHLVNGFLGSGKTTGIHAACRALKPAGKRVAVITNDQGIKLVDAAYFEIAGIAGRQVTDGCFCCNYHALDISIQSLITTNNPDTIFAESVGSCTDMVATVMKPLQQFYPAMDISFSTFADVRLLQMLFIQGNKLFDKPVHYIYQKQLEEAAVIVVSRIDQARPDELETVRNYLRQQFPQKKVVCVNGTSSESILQWLDALNDMAVTPASLQINYDVYAEGEAMMAWLDEEIELHDDGGKAEAAAMMLCERIHQKIQAGEMPIGHVKFMLNDTCKLSYTAVEEPVFPVVNNEAKRARLLINARVQTSPKKLQLLVQKSIQEVEREMNCKISVKTQAAFQPGYPRPAYRII